MKCQSKFQLLDRCVHFRDLDKKDIVFNAKFHEDFHFTFIHLSDVIIQSDLQGHHNPFVLRDTIYHNDRKFLQKVHNDTSFSRKRFKQLLRYLLILLRCSFRAGGVRHEAHHLIHAPAVWRLGIGHGLSVQTRVQWRHRSAHVAGVGVQGADRRAGGLMMESKHTDGGRRTVGDGHLWMKTHNVELLHIPTTETSRHEVSGALTDVSVLTACRLCSVPLKLLLSSQTQSSCVLPQNPL